MKKKHIKFGKKDYTTEVAGFFLYACLVSRGTFILKKRGLNCYNEYIFYPFYFHKYKKFPYCIN